MRKPDPPICVAGAALLLTTIFYLIEVENGVDVPGYLQSILTIILLVFAREFCAENH